MDSRKKNMSHKRNGLLKHQLQLVRRKDCDRFEVCPVPDSLSFEKGFFLFIRACQLLTQKMEGVILVGLAGPSGAGKTVFSAKVGNFMPGIAVISMDNYNDSSRVIDGNYDDPRLTDYDTLLDNLRDLRAGKAVEIPVYDFKLSRRIGYRSLEVPSSRIVIIEGIYALSERLRPLLDLRVSVTGGVHFDLVKRVLRDIHRSGQEPEDIIHQISETVYPMYKAFIEPDLETAHIKVVNKFNPFSGFQNATYILKSSRIVTEDQIREVLSADDIKETVEEIDDMYLLPPGEDPETCQSYLRMRNRDGIYSLMFEEWVIDEPFIISPRITFGVSVRLLSGLMALGYEIAAVLKRTSHVFSDDKITIKLDKLEQLHRKYVQVQGKDRSLVAECGRRLNLEGTYIPNSYIEQIQLEKLTAEVALPDDLRDKLTDKLSHTDEMMPSPSPSFSWLAEAKPKARNLYSKSYNSKEISIREVHFQRKGRHSKRWVDTSSKHDDRNSECHSSLEDQDDVHISEQMVGLNERLEEVLCRLGDLESKLLPPPASNNFLQRQNSCNSTYTGSLGSSGSCLTNGNMNGHAASPGMPQASAETVLIEEVRILLRGQRHLTNQLDLLSNTLHERYNSKKKNVKSRLRVFLRSMRTSNAGLASAAVFAAGLTTAVALVGVKMWKKKTG